VKKCALDYDLGFVNKERLVKIFDQILKARHETPMGDSLDHFISTNTFDISTFEMRDWIKEWVETRGLNNLEIVWDKDNAMFSNLIKIKQTMAIDGERNLRSHRLKVAFFDYEGQIFKLKDVLVSSQEHSNLLLEDPNRVPHALLLDSEGNSLFTSSIEAGSLQFFLNHLHTITDEFVILTALQRLAYMVSTSALSSLSYIQLSGRLITQKGENLSPLLLQQAMSLAHYIIEEFSLEYQRNELKNIIYEACSRLLGKESVQREIVVNGIWRFLTRRDQAKEILTFIHFNFINDPNGGVKMSIQNLFETFKAYYLIDKDERHYNDFIQVATGSGVKNSVVQDYSNWLQLVIKQDPEQELILFKGKEKVLSFEGLRVALTSLASENYLRKLLDIAEEKANKWSSQMLITKLNIIWDLTRDVERLEIILAQASKLNGKNKQTLIQSWVKSKTAQLQKIKNSQNKSK